MTITPDLATIISDAIEDRLIDVHVSLPGTIQSYDETTQTAVVELGLNRFLESENGTLVSEALPVLQNVRVCFNRSKNFYVAFRLEPGDTGDVIFSEASMGQWLATGGVSDPEDVGRCTLSGAKFYPGLVTDENAITDDLSAGCTIGKIGGVKMTFTDGNAAKVATKNGYFELLEDGSIEGRNENGDFSLYAGGQFAVNRNFTVDP